MELIQITILTMIIMTFPVLCVVDSQLFLYTTPIEIHKLGDVMVIHLHVPYHNCTQSQKENEKGVDFLLNQKKVCSVIGPSGCTQGAGEYHPKPQYQCGCMGSLNGHLYLIVTKSRNKHLTGNWTARDRGDGPGCLTSNCLSVIKDPNLDQQSGKTNDEITPKLDKDTPTETVLNNTTAQNRCTIGANCKDENVAWCQAATALSVIILFLACFTCIYLIYNYNQNFKIKPTEKRRRNRKKVPSSSSCSM